MAAPKHSKPLQALLISSLIWSGGPSFAADALQAEFILGTKHILGQGVPKDAAKGVGLVTRAAEAGNPAAQFALGTMMAAGQSLPKNPEGARSWLEKAAGQGYVPAQTALGELLLKSDAKQGEDWLLKAARAGDPFAQYRLADNLSRQGLSQEAFNFYEKSAKQGFPPAQQGLGLSYWVRKDYANAVHWLRLAAERGMARAKTYLGYAYAEGWSVPKDDSIAIRWWREGAAQNEPRSLEALGWAYENGRGVARNPAEARRWYQRAAAQGNQAAQQKLKDTSMKSVTNQEAGAAILLGLLVLGIATAGSGSGASAGGSNDGPTGGSPYGGGFMDMTDPIQLMGATMMMDIK
jgi:TPR repeat protein